MSALERFPVRHGATASLLVLAVVSAGSAQAQGGAARDSDRVSDRVYRLQMRRGDTNYVRSLRATRQQLEGRLDSLQHEFEVLGMDAPDRGELVRQLRTLISSLTDLSLLEQQVRSRVAERTTESLQRAKVQALMGTEVFAGQMRRSMTAFQPGWIGINAEAPHTRIVRDDSAYVRYFGYPEVVSVEPNSPAERVGIVRGDQLVAYDGADLRDREINLTRLLQPSRRLRVTVRRDGEERDFAVIVSKPPPQVVERWQLSVPDAGADGMPGMVLMSPRGEAAPRLRTGNIVLFGRMSPESAPVAGAEVTEIRNEELGHIFGVESGVLVTEVFSDPARASGLRGGDVIRRADGEEVTSVAQLRRMVAAHGAERTLELEIVRQKRTRSLTLRW